jgi:hypothetical protein
MRKHTHTNLDQQGRSRPLCYHHPVSRAGTKGKPGYIAPSPLVSHTQVLRAWDSVKNIPGIAELLAERLFCSVSQVSNMKNFIIKRGDKLTDFITQCAAIAEQQNIQ